MILRLPAPTTGDSINYPVLYQRPTIRCERLVNVECNPRSAGVRSKRDNVDTLHPRREFPGIQNGAFPEGTPSAENLVQFEVGSTST